MILKYHIVSKLSILFLPISNLDRWGSAHKNNLSSSGHKALCNRIFSLGTGWPFLPSLWDGRTSSTSPHFKTVMAMPHLTPQRASSQQIVRSNWQTHYKIIAWRKKDHFLDLGHPLLLPSLWHFLRALRPRRALHSPQLCNHLQGTVTPHWSTPRAWSTPSRPAAPCHRRKSHILTLGLTCNSNSQPPALTPEFQ